MPPLWTCPIYRGVYSSRCSHPLPGGRPRNHTSVRLLVLKSLTEIRSEIILCPAFKDACYLPTSGQRGWKDRHQTRRKHTRLFSITRGRQLAAEMEEFPPTSSAPEWSLLQTWLRKHGQRTLGASCPPGPATYPIYTDQTHTGKWKPPLSFCLYELLTGAIWTDWISPWKCWYFHDLKSLAQLE